MASPISKPSHSREIPIKVSILSLPSSATSTTSRILLLKVTLENTSPTQPIYILKWSSPLDPLSAAIGVFTFTSIKTGKKSSGLEMVINRQMPLGGSFHPDDEDILRIEAGGKIEAIIKVKTHEILLDKEEPYKVHAKGRWMGVWIGVHERLEFGEGSDLLNGEFESEWIVVEIPV